MHIKHLTLISVLLLCMLNSHAQSDSVKSNSAVVDRTAKSTHFESLDLDPHDSSVFHQPRNWSFITDLPKSLVAVPKIAFQKKNLWKTGAVAAATAVLIHYDQDITDGVKYYARQIHLDPQTEYINVIKAGNTRILKLPKNLNTTGYSLGEGWIGMAMTGGFWIDGKINRNYRSRQTASDLTQGFLLAAIETDLIKRCTGRESPFVKTQPGGKWRPLPSFSSFQKETEQYDAFPSGHLTTMMTTVIVLAEDYPESKLIKPIGYGLIAFTSLAMINTEVHWAGDYPLALALGYLNGKIVTQAHKLIEPKKKKKTPFNI